MPDTHMHITKALEPSCTNQVPPYVISMQQLKKHVAQQRHGIDFKLQAEQRRPVWQQLWCSKKPVMPMASCIMSSVACLQGPAPVLSILTASLRSQEAAGKMGIGATFTAAMDLPLICSARLSSPHSAGLHLELLQVWLCHLLVGIERSTGLKVSES